jgi:hypothetical protein
MTPRKGRVWGLLSGNLVGAMRTRQRKGKENTPGWGWVEVRVDSDDEEDSGDHQLQRTRRKSFLRWLLDRDKSNDRDYLETPTKQG